MREIKIGQKTQRVRATPLALLFYKKEFKRDLLGDLTKLSEAKDDLSKLDSIAMLQLIWAMAKADAGVGEPFPEFENWITTLEAVDFADPEFMVKALEEAQEGFFRGSVGPQK